VGRIDDAGWDEGWALSSSELSSGTGDDTMTFWIDNENDSATIAFTDATSYHLVTGTYDSSSDQKIYIDAELKDTEPDDWSKHGTESVLIGAGRDNGGPAYFATGIIDEVRISNIARNISWINTSYNTVNNTDTFLSFGSEEEISSNNPPIAIDDTAVTNEDTPVWIDVLSNDNDPDGTLDPSTVTITTGPNDPDGTLDPSTVTITTGPNNGNTNINTTTGEIQYTPNSNYYGTDNLTYTVNDNNGATSNNATVNITINTQNDPPPQST
jgi:hypothetical protein